MGMFDYVKCERIMPDGLDGHDQEFQTKDFDCPYLNVYIITNNGRLVTDKYHQELVPENERPYPDMPIIGCIKRVVDIPNYDLEYHGVLKFYGIDKNNKWHEYNAQFTDGQLVKLEATDEK